MSKIFTTLLIVCFIIVGVMSCKSTKSNDSTEQKITIELKKKFTETYILENYAMYNPVKVKRSNRTLNQYLATFELEAIRYKGLINLLNKDENVIKVIEKSNSGIDKAMQTKNQMKSISKAPVK